MQVPFFFDTLYTTHAYTKNTKSLLNRSEIKRLKLTTTATRKTRLAAFGDQFLVQKLPC